MGKLRRSAAQIAPLLLLLPAILGTLAQAQYRTLFWYTDIDDLLTGKAPDKRYPIPTGEEDYGRIIPLYPTEAKDGESVLDNIRGALDPPGANVNKVEWNPHLVKPAGVSASKCDGDTPGTTNASEIVVSAINQLTVVNALLTARTLAPNYSYQTNRCSTGECRAYKMLIKSGLTHFGCAAAHCPDTAVPYRVHCLLEPLVSVNVSFEKPYIPGTPCQLCPADRGYCYKNQCVNHGVKTNILTNNTNAVITCSAPCMNCGQRKEIDQRCTCHCPVGFASAEDCSAADSDADPNFLTCGPCARQGTPCKNGGLEPEADSCTGSNVCLCPSDFKGRYCEIPGPGFDGGVNLPTGPVASKYPNGTECNNPRCITVLTDLNDLPKIITGLKPMIADTINNFCTQNQDNYIKCCGSGTLPTRGPRDFVNASDVKSIDPPAYDAAGRLITGIYVEARGNNGLCRKITSLPPPIVAVPPEVLIEVINSKLPELKNIGCITNVTDTVKDSVVQPPATDISVIKVKIG